LTIDNFFAGLRPEAPKVQGALDDELAADGDHDGAVTWRRITDAVGQLANTTPPGPVH
jgi:hypothetical protein